MVINFLRHLSERERSGVADSDHGKHDFVMFYSSLLKSIVRQISSWLYDAPLFTGSLFPVPQKLQFQKLIFLSHGGGLVFKTLQWLVQNLDANKISVGAIFAGDENRASRHLKDCASERKIPLMLTCWEASSFLGEQALLSSAHHPDFGFSIFLDIESRIMKCLLAAAAYGAFKELLASIHGIYEEQLLVLLHLL
ncbi:hypothetical protein Vadar_015284 [Vaccinium darrowii]|uniref:Uncharacterized protein n=1 Tax=Vaccinium darrowii TaxID=229202 RepID=A0ACB7ZBP0_9ERIC|nr:hypothetical protein Vadar_015284 [Vaccinium darrowii]